MARTVARGRDRGDRRTPPGSSTHRALAARVQQGGGPPRLRMPCRTPARASCRLKASVDRPARSAASPIGTASSGRKAQDRSSTVRARLVTRNPPSLDHIDVDRPTRARGLARICRPPPGHGGLTRPRSDAARPGPRLLTTRPPDSDQLGPGPFGPARRRCSPARARSLLSLDTDFMPAKATTSSMPGRQRARKSVDNVPRRPPDHVRALPRLCGSNRRRKRRGKGANVAARVGMGGCSPWT